MRNTNSSDAFTQKMNKGSSLRFALSRVKYWAFGSGKTVSYRVFIDRTTLKARLKISYRKIWNTDDMNISQKKFIKNPPDS